MAIPITLPGLHTPGAGFDTPFAMLEACHDRVRRSLALLQRLVARLGTQGCDFTAQDAARDVLRYFDLAAPAHHDDEERHVLPLLATSDDPALRAAAVRLQRDHEAIRAAWAAVRLHLHELLDTAGCDDLPALAAAAARFIAAHDGHLEFEETLAFPAAFRLHPDLSAMGDEMAARRGLRLQRSPATS